MSLELIKQKHFRSMVYTKFVNFGVVPLSVPFPTPFAPTVPLSSTSLASLTQPVLFSSGKNSSCHQASGLNNVRCSDWNDTIYSVQGWSSIGRFYQFILTVGSSDNKPHSLHHQHQPYQQVSQHQFYLVVHALIGFIIYCILVTLE